MGFAKPVSRKEALGIMHEAENAWLIHKAFHPGSRESKQKTSICNCCKDCCDTLRLWWSGTLPLINSTYHLALIDPDSFTGCGTCVQGCPTDAIVLNAEGWRSGMKAPVWGAGFAHDFARRKRFRSRKDCGAYLSCPHGNVVSKEADTHWRR